MKRRIHPDESFRPLFVGFFPDNATFYCASGMPLRLWLFGYSTILMI